MTDGIGTTNEGGTMSSDRTLPTFDEIVEPQLGDIENPFSELAETLRDEGSDRRGRAG